MLVTVVLKDPGKLQYLSLMAEKIYFCEGPVSAGSSPSPAPSASSVQSSSATSSTTRLS